MENQETKSKKGLYAVLIIILIVVIGVGGYFLIKNMSGIKGETFTAENYDELMDRISEELNNTDDIYYLSYSMMYYIMRDGFTSALSGSEDESVMYANIYGKTVQQLIDEGKQLMEDNNITLDQYKGNLEDVGNIF